MSTRIEDRNLGGYRAADQCHDFTYDTGVIQLPVASRVAASRLIRLHGGTGDRRVSFRFVREGKPPIIPTMEDTTGDRLLSARVSPATPTPSATGSGLDWIVSGEYVYAQNTPRIVGVDPIPVGQLPYLDQALLTQADNATPRAAVNAYRLTFSQDPAQAYSDFVGDLEAATTINLLGDYSWPFFVIGPAFTSSHIIQD